MLFLAIGLGISIWLADKATRFPEIQASQFGHTAPLWIPSLLFVLACSGAAAYLFWRAARRVEAGEDLFARRHRRHPSEREPSGQEDG